MSTYVHGYDARENRRLREQSDILRDILHAGTAYPKGASVLEAGCGVGAQSVILAERSPEARFTAIDISEDSLKQAEAAVRETGHPHYAFKQADIHALPFADESFDHIFLCFVLEHLDDPLKALAELRRALKTGGTLTLIEGDHGSCFWHPETEASLKVWQCMIRAQAKYGHNANIGREVYPLLAKSDFTVQSIEPRYVYGDGFRPKLLDGMVNQIIIPMVETAKARSLEAGWTDEALWKQGISDLHETSLPPTGTFFYTWFKAVGVK